MSVEHKDGALTIEIPQPESPLSINRAAGRRWVSIRADVQAWKAAIALELRPWILEQPSGTTFFIDTPLIVVATLSFRTNQRRDPHNYTGTVVKAMVDGLTLAGLIPDDTAEFVSVLDPILRVDRSDLALLHVSGVTITTPTQEEDRI